ncbi:hypothetical protein NFHSH190041_22100 [Shewanella sp. NFH-SH190041]|uniref:hypothetical protein n=1 Tax=Shewanella sp. NFH-SH190041 TaxID=2950245 RepID=UPI0021C28A5B|nr:hypothetical protein [Shewanella sp. NFH-SH190041]BDM64758.1 hypothetical protein NFHSH190041_22100 [Shewanella sp. NFH-SH190041]
MEEILLKNAALVIGALFTAMIAGFFAFINLISSKEQKVSEFRQDWINQLRNAISEYISSLSYLSILYKHHSEQESSKKKSKLDMAQSVDETYSKLNKSYNDILFRINPKEKNKKHTLINNEFLTALSETRELYMKSDFLGAVKACDKLRNKTKPLLKYEWIRVKSGEPKFKFWKNFAVLILAMGFSLSLYCGYQLLNAVQAGVL